jgi:uncharacterized membrane protein YdfJ with MMPL/SSD domain
LRFVEERGRGLAPRQAMDATARRTGRAFMVSGMTAIAGVAVLGTSSMPLLSDFGIIVAINITVALLSALVVLPPILVWADERNWVSRGLIRKPPPQYETMDERYPPHVEASANGEVPPPPSLEPQPVAPGSHVPPAPAPVPLWLPQFEPSPN